MTQSDVEHDPAVTSQVLSYFVRNHKAVDTLEGIARWRLTEEQIRQSVQQTEASLTWLVKEGFLEQVSPASGQASLFRLNPQRLEEAQSFLADSGGKNRRKASGKKSK